MTLSRRERSPRGVRHSKSSHATFAGLIAPALQARAVALQLLNALVSQRGWGPKLPDR